jgi:L-lysine exporter family protein LysE/ArgO
MQIIVVLFIGIITTIIGALPFGLVNLTVLDTSYHNGHNSAMKVAHGAAWIEVLFGLLAILVGNSLIHVTRENQFAHSFILFLPALIGLFFLFKKASNSRNTKTKNSGFLKGVFLNLISLQMLLYWLIAITYLNSHHVLFQNKIDVILFLIGIWLGKMLVLWFYSYLSQQIYSRWKFLTSNINRVIGGLLLLTAFIQFLK